MTIDLTDTNTSAIHEALTDARRRLGGGLGVGWHGYGLLDRHRGANYKILPPDPIGLPLPCAFSTSSARTPDMSPDLRA